MKLHVNSWVAYNLAMDQAKVRVAVDAGANDGGYTATLLEHGFEVHSFEPVPEMFEKLKARVGHDKRATLNQCALGDRFSTQTGIQVLEAWTLGRPGDGGLSVSPDFKDAPGFKMTTMRLDDYLGETPIGILKLDVDGHEFKVLKGAARTLRRDKPPILCEFGCYLSKLFGPEAPRQMVEFIFDLGYKVVSCDAKHEFTRWDQIEPQWPWHTTFDVVLLPR